MNSELVTYYPRDSGYLGGVFYFSANDLLGVRPVSDPSGRTTYRYANSPAPGGLETGNYFGAFMLAADPRSRMTETEQCCDNGILMQ